MTDQLSETEDVPTREELEEIEHLAKAMAYQAGDLNPTEAAAFEAHLPTCALCPPVLADAPGREKQLLQLGDAMPVATFTPKHTVEEQVQRFDAMVKQERKARVQRIVLWSAAAAVLVAAVAVGVLRQPTVQHDAQKMYAP
jgi:anti-sigma factor RsiW